MFHTSCRFARLSSTPLLVLSSLLFINVSHVSGSANGEPSFTGLRGQSYQVHGISGAVYNLIRDEYISLNSRFVFLTSPRECPTPCPAPEIDRSLVGHTMAHISVTSRSPLQSAINFICDKAVLRMVLHSISTITVIRLAKWLN